MREWLIWTVLAAVVGVPAADGAQKVVVVAIDGLDYRYLRDADKLHLKIPVLRKLMASGQVADGVIGVTPAGTWPAMTSMVTGVSPWQHGITAADRSDRASQKLTLWQAAASAHLKTALLYWPASLDAGANFLCPETWVVPRESATPFEVVAAKCTPGLVDRVGSVYPRFTKSVWNDETAMDALAYLLEFEQPDLSMVHLAELDAEEHETGALSLYSHEVLENDDELLGQILKKLPLHAIVAVVSDHGVETEDHVVRPRQLLRSVPGLSVTESSAVEVKYGLIGASDARAAAALRKMIGNKKTGIAREISAAELRHFAPEINNWVAAFGTMPGFIPIDEKSGPAVGPGNHKGVHELWPTRPSFRSVFLLWGETVKPGRMGEISMLEIAPTLASILGIRLPDAKERSLWPQMQKR